MSVVEHTSHDPGHGSGAPPHRRGLLMRPGLHPRRLVLRAVLPDRPLPRRGHPLARRLGSGLRLEHHRPRRRPRRSARSGSCSASARSTTGSTGSPAARRCPRTTPATARTTWKDYFKVNTDHKVIGVQYLVTTFVFFIARRPDGDALPRRARAAGDAVHGHADLQRPRLRARGADDLRLHHPCLRRASRTSRCR